MALLYALLLLFLTVLIMGAVFAVPFCFPSTIRKGYHPTYHVEYRLRQQWLPEPGIKRLQVKIYRRWYTTGKKYTYVTDKDPHRFLQDEVEEYLQEEGRKRYQTRTFFHYRDIDHD